MIIVPGSTNQSIYFKLVDPTDGTPETGLVIAALTASYVRDRTAAATNALAALGAVNAAHADNGAIEIDAVNCPGLYRVDYPDAAFAAGVDRVQLVVNGAAIDPAVIEVELAATLDIADAVWDEVLTEATHDVGYSAGQRLRLLIMTGAAAQGGTANTITLAVTESAVDHIFNENIISIVSGTGAGQTRLIAEYVGATRVATVDKAWFVNPDATSVYEIHAFSSILVAHHGVAQAATASSITLAATASAVSDSYVGSVAYISSGTGVGQVRLVTAYDGATKIATVSNNWTTTPDNTSVYKILPVGRVIVDSLAADAMTDIADAVLSRGVDNVEATADVGSLAELILAAFESALAGVNWTIYETDHLTVFNTRTVSLNATAQPVVGVT